MQVIRKQLVLLCALGVTIAAMLIATSIQKTQASDQTFILNSHCPPGFELMQDNSCELRSLYQFYNSTQNRGVGGTQTGLPPYTDGFSPQQIDLGRYLFFDPVLSGDQSVSCANCHNPQKGFADGRDVSIGAHGNKTSRSAPSLWNSAFLTRMFWDARATDFAKQVQEPLYDSNEMANTPSGLLKALNKNPTYRRLFTQAFSHQKTSTESLFDEIQIEDVYSALTAFQTSLISLNSRYDEYAHGNHTALNNEEIAGMNVFRSFVARCSECHTPPLFTNNQIAVIGTPEAEGKALDIGAEKTFNAPQLKGGFKVPTLRNISKTAPYMHSGVFENLREATQFYNKGRGHAVPEGVNLLLHWHISEPDLSDREIDLIVTFMGALDDEKFMPEIPNKVPSGLTPITRNSSLAVDNNYPQ
ncbi:MAG: cytochrome c peroxidase [Cryomorphaceae bacterium]|jgi:cytochrome c peroxidase